MSQLRLLLLCLTIVDSFVVVKIYPNAVYEPHSVCGFIRNMTWPQPASIQSCIWECVHEPDCQTAVFHKTENNCSLFVELCSTDRVLTSRIFAASTICYRKKHGNRPFHVVLNSHSALRRSDGYVSKGGNDDWKWGEDHHHENAR